MPNGNIYPRGFLLPLGPVGDSDDKNVRVPGDEEVSLLYTLYMNQTVNSESWEYRKRVFKAARRLFKDFSHWVGLQTKNEHIYGFNYEFLLDTLNYILTGKRSLSVTDWAGLLIEAPEPKKQDVIERFSKANLHPLFKEKGYATEDILTAWCAKPHGFEDMVCTLYVLFGNGLGNPNVSNSNCN